MAGWTGANERTVKNWISGRSAPCCRLVSAFGPSVECHSFDGRPLGLRLAAAKGVRVGGSHWRASCPRCPPLTARRWSGHLPNAESIGMSCRLRSLDWPRVTASERQRSCQDKAINPLEGESLLLPRRPAPARQIGLGGELLAIVALGWDPP